MNRGEVLALSALVVTSPGLRAQPKVWRVAMLEHNQ